MYNIEVRRTPNKEWYFNVVDKDKNIICKSKKQWKEKLACKAIAENLGFNLLEPVIEKVDNEGLTILHIKQRPNASTMDALKKLSKANGLSGHLIFFFAEGEMRKLSEEEMTDLGWIFVGNTEQHADELMVVEE